MKSQFTRKIKIIEPQKIYKKPWDDPKWDGLRPDKQAIPKATDKEGFVITCNTARIMEKLFGRKPWMKNFINENGENLPYQEGLIT